MTERDRRRLARELRRQLRGEVLFDRANRAVYATDSSNYRQVPLGVVCPRDHDDVVAAMQVCAAFDAPVVARGAGTSLAGQACNVAVVIDTGRNMSRILEIDADRREAIVEPGVVLDDLRNAAQVHGLTFGPDPATHAWCTLGGMIGNNSCGTHAIHAGKTVDNVDRLVVVLYGGETLDVGAYDRAAYATAIRGGGALASVLGGLREIGARHADAIRTGFPRIPRRVSGFNLDQLLPDAGFHVARALVGTESTCAIVTQATVRLVPSPTHRRLVVVGFDDVFAAADAVPSMLKNPLLGLEGFDASLVEQMRVHGLNSEQLPLLPDGNGWLIAEVGADDAAQTAELAKQLIASLPSAVRVREFAAADEQRQIWAIRDSALGATAIRPDGTHNFEGWEDGAVPPERLGQYLREISKLWTQFGYSGSWYGHFGQGCVHTRNNFDLHGAEGLRTYRAYVERAADLVVSLGGSLSGEHGDGQARGELLERMYGAELIDAFRQFKAVFDPRGRMNPGKVVDPYPLDTNLRMGPRHVRTTVPKLRFTLRGGSATLQEAVERCVGVGKCRGHLSGTMCPSYRVTRDERPSTRGRARLLAEMLQGDVVPTRRHSVEVREALDLCLSCKGCLSDCPTHVDMATYKAEFLSHYYARRPRPRSMYALGLVPWAARVAAKAPRLANWSLSAPIVGVAMRAAAGVSRSRPAPSFAVPSWRKSLRGRGVLTAATADVVVWPDTFTDAFRPTTGLRLVAVLERLGQRVVVPRDWACCGRPLYDMGMLTLARRSLRRLLDVLGPWIDAGTPVVVVEPSCLAAFRDELPALLADDERAARLAALARSPAEHLLAIGVIEAIEAIEAIGTTGGALARSDGPAALIHPHCHARALGAHRADEQLLRGIGVATTTLDGGCCGLAGSFGFRPDHDAVSREIGNGWLRAIDRESAGESALVVDGFSCATQLTHLSSRESTTLIDIVHARLFGHRAEGA
ncbi:MAG TPA: FAD-binding and (Fe-S)-binding domain-containing protein [Acidothermaceae bacterium]|nr:FAD-binding and (Fe-S)-binding domain-containing protein [Acidothermaceae bacterium]